MKKSKLLVVGLAAAALGLAGAATGTVAWFQASATVTEKKSEQQFIVNKSTIDLGNLYLKVDIQVGSEVVEYTDKNGSCWVVANGVMAPAKDGVRFGTITMTPHLYNDPDCAEAHLATEAEKLTVAERSYTFSLVASEQARITYTDPGTTAEAFKTAFGDNFENTLTLIVKCDGAGGLTIGTAANPTGGTQVAYYSVSGQANNDVPDAGDTAVGQSGSTATKGKITIDKASA